MNISLRQLKAFLGVADSANFTKTAQHLHLSQAGLSATIRELESQLNTRLFERTTRAVVLTEAGRVFLPTAALIERELSAAALRLRDMERQDVATLRVGFTPLMASNIVPEVLLRFAKRHPKVEVDVVDGSPVEIQQLVESGGLDAAFGAFFSKVSGLRREAIIPSQLVAVYSPTRPPRNLPPHDADGESALPWQSLNEEALVCLTQESPVQMLTEEALFRNKLNIPRRMTVKHLETAISMAEKGFGTAIIPSFAQGACLRYAVECRTLVPRVSFDFYYIARAGAAEAATLTAFVKIFEQVASEMAARPAA